MQGSVLERELADAETVLQKTAPDLKTAGSSVRARLAALGIAVVLHGGLLFLAARSRANHSLPFRPEEVVFIDLRQPIPAIFLPETPENSGAVFPKSDEPKKH